MGGMTWIAPDVVRDDPPYVADERAALHGWLEFHRQTLLWKCSGLTGEQLAARPAAPSSLSLLGLIRHMAKVERWWFRQQFAGRADLEYLYCTAEDPDGDFDLGDALRAEQDFAVFAAERAAADETVRGRSLDETFRYERLRRGHQVTDVDLRWVYLHMIEEYARHNGHADMLRERIDGGTGQ